MLGLFAVVIPLFHIPTPSLFFGLKYLILVIWIEMGLVLDRRKRPGISRHCWRKLCEFENGPTLRHHPDLGLGIVQTTWRSWPVETIWRRRWSFLQHCFWNANKQLSIWPNSFLSAPQRQSTLASLIFTAGWVFLCLFRFFFFQTQKLPIAYYITHLYNHMALISYVLSLW